MSKIVMVHYYSSGVSESLSKRFKYPSYHFEGYKHKNMNKIVIIGRHFYKGSNIWNMISFIEEHRKDIIGVIFIDDKNFGEGFGVGTELYKSNKVPLLALWDLLVSEEDINKMEELLDEYI